MMDSTERYQILEDRHEALLKMQAHAVHSAGTAMLSLAETMLNGKKTASAENLQFKVTVERKR